MAKSVACRAELLRSLLAAWCLAWPAALGAQAPIRLGGEFQVNSFTTSDQRYPTVGVNDNGNFVVAWISKAQDGSSWGIFASRFSATGAPQAAEFQVNSYTTSDQRFASVAVDADGDFVVAWQSSGQDGSNYGVFAQRFDSSGVAQAAEFQVNTYTTSYQRYPAVAANPGGSFIVTWQSFGQDGAGFGVFAKRYDASGSPLSDEFQVNTYTLSSQAFASVDLDADGGFVIAWHSFGQDGSSNGIFARRFDSTGDPKGGEIQVNQYTESDQGNASVAVDGSGNFVVTWTSSGQDGSGAGAFARRFDSAGVAQATEFQVNTYTSGNQRLPTVAMDRDGSFVIVWDGYQNSETSEVFARRFSAGVPVGAEFQINTYTEGYQDLPAVAQGGGIFVVAWESTYQDDSDDGVFAQRLAVPDRFDIDGNGATHPLTDGILIMRFLSGSTGSQLVNGAVDLDGCTRCDAAAIEAYLQSLL
jgi:hypothetical protein